jgi:hypothetical protein
MYIYIYVYNNIYYKYNNKNYGIFGETNYYIYVINYIIIIYNRNITPTLNFFLELYIVTESGLIVSIIYLPL